ncbi:MAG: acyltransferase family protein [Lachnospiraceae bacterium]
MKERNRSIDAIKGVAITLVMLGHVFVHNFMEDPYLYDFIKVVQMPLFMIVSGYLGGIGRKVSDFGQYREILGKRAVTYLVPLFFWLTILHPDELGYAYRTIFFHLDYGLWFLAVLFLLTFFVCTAQLAASFAKERKLLSEVVFWGVYGIFCLILLIQCLSGNTFLSPSLTLLYVPFYMLGYVTGNYGRAYLCWGTGESGKLDCKDSRFVRAVVPVMAVFLIRLIIVRDLNAITGLADTIIQMIASVLGSLTVIYAVLWWKEGRIRNFFAWIGQYTLEIYVIHYHFAYLLNLKHQRYEFYSWKGFLFVIASFAVMSAVTWLCILLLKRFAITDLLAFGKRKEKK